MKTVRLQLTICPIVDGKSTPGGRSCRFDSTIPMAEVWAKVKAVVLTEREALLDRVKGLTEAEVELLLSHLPNGSTPTPRRKRNGGTGIARDYWHLDEHEMALVLAAIATDNDTLSKMEKDVLNLRFPAVGGTRIPLTDIAAEYKMPRKDVQFMIRSSLKKLGIRRRKMKGSH